jgi:amidase
MVPLALGTQTTASVIRPAAFCGIVGAVPTHGTLPLAGVKPNAPSFDTIGVFARKVGDAALLLDVLRERSPVAPDTIAAPRLGVCRTPYWSTVDTDVARIFDDAVATLARGGAQIRDVSFPLPADQIARAHGIVSARELTLALAYERAFHGERISQELRAGKLAQGASLDDAAVIAAQRLLDRARLQIDDAWDACDAWIAPSAGVIAPLGLTTTGSPLFCTLWTALHLPAVSIPAPAQIEGMPVGVQLVAPRGHDRTLLECAQWAESVLAAAGPQHQTSRNSR